MAVLFSPFVLGQASRTLTLANRIVIAPMCQYSAYEGQATDWHLMHWGQMLNGGAAMFTLEATAVLPEGRITPACLGLWDEVTQAALSDRLQRARACAPHTAVCIQLAHAGRKASSAVPWAGGQLLSATEGGWLTQAPSAVPHLPQETPPHALDTQGLSRVRQAFVDAAVRAEAMGIDAIELHAAHGYLLHQFLSPLANQRTDVYGGSFENRIRFPLEVFTAMRQACKGVLGIRISASDWVEGGWSLEESAALALHLKAAACDFIHVSSGGLSAQQKIQLGPNYQVPFAERIKAQSAVPTIAVGLITEPQQAEHIVQSGQADLVALARAYLYQPHWAWQAAAALHAQVQVSPQYWRCAPRESQGLFKEAQMGQR